MPCSACLPRTTVKGDVFSMTMGERIKAKRLERGFTLDELAARVGVQKTAIHKYENGVITNIPLDRLERIADALGCTSGYLYLGEDSPIYDAKTQRIISMVEKMTEAQKDALLNLFAPSDD